MKFYLSSYQLGNETDKLKKLVPYGKIGYIPNAIDYPGYDPERRKVHIQKDIDLLAGLDVKVEIIDLRDYFHKQAELKTKIVETGAIFISGGNVFVLRQAFKLSGFDEILKELRDNRDFLYVGYSAGGGILPRSLKGIELVDEPVTAYPELNEVIWEGLGFIDFAFAPHWKSDHPETALIEKLIEYYVQHNIPYKAIRDGEVIIIE